MSGRPARRHDHGGLGHSKRPSSAPSTNKQTSLRPTTSTSSSLTPFATSALSLESTALSPTPRTSTSLTSSKTTMPTTFATATLSSSLSRATSAVSSLTQPLPSTSTITKIAAELVTAVSFPLDQSTVITLLQSPSLTQLPSSTGTPSLTGILGSTSIPNLTSLPWPTVSSGVPSAETQNQPAAPLTATSAEAPSRVTVQSSRSLLSTQPLPTTYTAASEMTAGPVAVNDTTQPAAASDVSNTRSSSGLSTAKLAAVIIVPLVLIILSFAFLFLLWRKRRRRKSPLLGVSEKQMAMAENDSDSAYAVRPAIPQQPPPIIILPNAPARNQAYHIGIDTSEAYSVRGSSNGSYRATSLEEPPPPYNYQPGQSEPPRRTMSALPAGYLEEPGSGISSLREESIISPFADPEDDATSGLCGDTERGLGRMSDDRASTDSGLSYQRDATRVHQTF